MTCREKFIKDHPYYSEKQLNSIFDNDCPSDYGIADDPRGPNCYTHCSDCWDREIPETEPSESDEPIKARDEHAFELANKNARIAELEQQNRNQYDLINEKIAEITVCHTRINELTNNLEESNKIKKEQLKVINELQAKHNNLEKELKDEKERIESLEYQYTHLVSKYMAQGLENNVTESDTSCAQSADDIRHAIARSMFNKYHALLDVGFSNDDALKLTVVWKD